LKPDSYLLIFIRGWLSAWQADRLAKEHRFIGQTRGYVRIKLSR